MSRQLVEAAQKEAEIRREIKRLKEQYQRERMKIGEHFSYIESLKVEISRTIDKETELKRKIYSFTDGKTKNIVKQNMPIVTNV